MYVVIGQAPNIDTSHAVGPFRSYATALAASQAMDRLGYNTEIAELFKLSDLREHDRSEQ